MPWENLDAHQDELSLATYVQAVASELDCESQIRIYDYANYSHFYASIRDMSLKAKWLVHLTEAIPNNPTTEELARELYALTKELGDRYDISKPENAPSPAYCEAKLENIEDAAGRIAEAFAQKEY